MRTFIFLGWVGICLCIHSNVWGQIDRNNSEWMRYLEEMTGEEESDNEALADLYDELSQIVEHPYNLHTVGKQDLEKLPFLTGSQIENLLYYLYKYSPLTDITELKNVEDLDWQTLTYLLPFVYVGARPQKDNPGKPYFRQELMFRSDYTLQDKAAYDAKNYLGDPFYLNFRYNLELKDKLQVGIGGEKDAGEPFGKFGNKGLDYYTFNVNFKNMGVLETLHLGNYRLSFGQGLVMNNSFSMGKTSDAIHTNQKSSGIQRHISTNENQYFSGVAGTFHKNNVRFSLFYSNRKLDANADDSVIYTFKTDGYHRTYNDWLKRNTAQVELSGLNAQWRKEAFSLGLTAVHYAFGGKELNPDWKPYNTFHLRGKSHFNTGINYTYRSKKGNLEGEIATDNSGKIAQIHHLQFRPASFMDWVISFRQYDKEYNALYGKGFSEATGIQNETGFYTGMKIRMLQRMELSAYFDRFIFPWLKYGIHTPSDGEDVMLQIKYNLRSNLQMNLRYKFKEKYTDVAPYHQHRLRYQLDYRLNPAWHFNTEMNWNTYQSEKKDASAWSFTQSATYAPDKSKFQIDGVFACFHAGDWESRISIYEKNVLYAFSFPNYYGQGFRYYTVVKWKIIKPLTLYLKGASTHYFDQKTDKTDFYLLIKYDF